jgi:hypothetical protein
MPESATIRAIARVDRERALFITASLHRFNELPTKTLSPAIGQVCSVETTKGFSAVFGGMRSGANGASLPLSRIS